MTRIFRAAPRHDASKPLPMQAGFPTLGCAAGAWLRRSLVVAAKNKHSPRRAWLPVPQWQSYNPG